MRNKLLIFIFSLPLLSYGQLNLLPISSAFKDDWYKPTFYINSNNNGDFLPIIYQMRSFKIPKDSLDIIIVTESKKNFRQGQLVEVKGDDYLISFSPLFNFKSIWSESPIITNLDSSPILEINVFISTGEQFCDSSKIQ